MPVIRQNGLGADTNYYGPGGSWISNGCFIGDPADWPSFQRNYLCNLPYTSCPIPCPADTCGGGNAAACPGGAPAPATPPPSPYSASPDAGKTVTSPKITVETSEGPVEISADFVPGVSDGALTPAQIRIPNIWDQLDPTKTSQFDYRGLATSLPVWISDRWRETLNTAAGPMAPPAPAGDPIAASSEVPLWVWAAIAAAAWAMRPNKTATRRRFAA